MSEPQCERCSGDGVTEGGYICEECHGAGVVPEPPVAAPDHARADIELLRDAALGWPTPNPYTAACDQLEMTLAALLAERQQMEADLRNALHGRKLAELDTENEQRILGEVLAERRQDKERIERLNAALVEIAAPEGPLAPGCRERRVLRMFAAAVLAGEGDATPTKGDTDG